MTRAIGHRQAGALTVLWVLHPRSVRGRVLGAVLEPGGNGTHGRRSVVALAGRNLIRSTMVEPEGQDPYAMAYTLTNDGISALRRWALARGAMTVEVIR